MGSGHEVTPLDEIMVPTGIHAAFGDPIIDRAEPATTTHFDTVGDLARCANTLFEHCKPQLVCDLPGVEPWIGTQGSTDYERVALYRIPGRMLNIWTATNGNLERVHLSCFASVTSGTGTLKLISRYNSTSVLDSRTGSFTNTSRDWVEGVYVETEPGSDRPEGGDVIIELQARHSASNDLLDVASIELYWDVSGETLPTGPYQADVLPLYNSNFEQYLDPLSVSEMQKLIRMYDYLLRYRTGGMIIATWNWEPTTDAGARCLAFQGEYVTTARFYVWMDGGVDGGFQHIVIDDGEISFADSTFIEAAGGYWRMVEIALPPTRGVVGGSIPRVWTVNVYGDGTTVLNGISGWWMPIDRF